MVAGNKHARMVDQKGENARVFDPNRVGRHLQSAPSISRPLEYRSLGIKHRSWEYTELFFAADKNQSVDRAIGDANESIFDQALGFEIPMPESREYFGLKPIRPKMFGKCFSCSLLYRVVTAQDNDGQRRVLRGRGSLLL